MLSPLLSFSYQETLYHYFLLFAPNFKNLSVNTDKSVKSAIIGDKVIPDFNKRGYQIMLIYDFSGRGTHPLYEYLYHCLKADILNGRIPAGTKLPSKRELAADNQISVRTVHECL